MSRFYSARPPRAGFNSKASTPKVKNPGAFTPKAQQPTDTGLVRLVLKSGSSVTMKTETVEVLDDEGEDLMVCGSGQDNVLRAVPMTNIDYFEECK